MATKLKNMKLTSVDLVRAGANQEADICLYKSADPSEATEGSVTKEKNLFRRFLAWMQENDSEPSEEPPVEKEDLHEENSPVKTLDFYIDTLEESFESILHDPEVDGTAKRKMMQQSLQEFAGAMGDLIPDLCGTTKEETTEAEEETTEIEEEIDVIEEKSADENLDIIEEVAKYNHNHDALGRFSSGNGGGGGSASGGSSDGSSDGNTSGGSESTSGGSGGSGDVTSAENVASHTAEVKEKLSNEYEPFQKEESVNMDKVKERGGCTDEQAQHAVNLAENVYNQAASQEPKITEDIVTAAAQSGGQMYGLDYRMKQTTSMAGKIAQDSADSGGELSYEAAASDIKDAIRYTAVFDSENFTASYEGVKSQLESLGYKEIRCKNFYDMYESGTSCQKAVQCVYENKNGQKFEFQFHTPESQGAKEINHPLYEEQRAVTTSQSRKDELNSIMTEIGSHVPDPEGVHTIASHK